MAGWLTDLEYNEMHDNEMMRHEFLLHIYVKRKEEWNGVWMRNVRCQHFATKNSFQFRFPISEAKLYNLTTGFSLFKTTKMVFQFVNKIFFICPKKTAGSTPFSFFFSFYVFSLFEKKAIKLSLLLPGHFQGRIFLDKCFNQRKKKIKLTNLLYLHLTGQLAS